VLSSQQFQKGCRPSDKPQSAAESFFFFFSTWVLQILSFYHLRIAPSFSVWVFLVFFFCPWLASDGDPFTSASGVAYFVC
jgi:hypothetical protein